MSIVYSATFSINAVVVVAALALSLSSTTTKPDIASFKGNYGEEYWSVCVWETNKTSLEYKWVFFRPSLVKKKRNTFLSNLLLLKHK